MSAKLQITINGKKHELDAKEARNVFDQLKAFLGEPMIPYQAPIVIIDREPVHIYPPPQPQWPQPFFLQPTITCQSHS